MVIISDETTFSILNALHDLYNEYKDGSSYSSIRFLGERHMAPDYNKILCDLGRLKRISGGARGRGQYKWIGGVPTKKLAKELQLIYNDKRNGEGKERLKSMNNKIHNIDAKFDTIISLLKSIQKTMKTQQQCQ